MLKLKGKIRELERQRHKLEDQIDALRKAQEVLNDGKVTDAPHRIKKRTRLGSRFNRWDRTHPVGAFLHQRVEENNPYFAQPDLIKAGLASASGGASYIVRRLLELGVIALYHRAENNTPGVYSISPYQLGRQFPKQEQTHESQ